MANTLFAQQESPDYDEKSLFETLTKIEKKTDKFNLFLNMHAGFNANWLDGNFERGNFNVKQLRIEAKGNINDWIFYRYRQRLNRSNDGSGFLDNMPKSIDIASVGFKVTPKFSIIGGKMCTMYGGFEFDLNPIDIYEYSDMIEYMDNFLTGVNFIYDFTPAQQLAFQIVDGRNGSFESTYGNVRPGVEDTKLPLLY
ncbi:MAG: porin, partial [Bacteroidales bacterium]